MIKLVLLILLSIFTIGINFAQSELYGVSFHGGTTNSGVIFKTDSLGNNQSVVYDFLLENEGENPAKKLCQATNGMLYGLTTKGCGFGDFDGHGVLFEYNPTTGVYTKKIDFSWADKGGEPIGSLVLASNGKLYGMTSCGGTSGTGYLDGVIFEYDPITNVFTKKIEFVGTNGGDPDGSLIQASNGKLYGMTPDGGTNGLGVLFEYNPVTNILTKKVDFNGSALGAKPYGGSLMQATNGKLYGMTSYGGTNYEGVIFEYNIILDTLIVKVNLDGVNKGARPGGDLIQLSNGKLYGMTRLGGSNGQGVIFEYNPLTNVFTKKIDFDGSNKGAYPMGSLMQASNGKLYGLTKDGGSNGVGVLFEYSVATNGFIKKIDFETINNGSHPGGTLMQATNGKLYGMAIDGGMGSVGVLFRYDYLTNIFTKEVDFSKAVNGQVPSISLLHASNGKIYGMTVYGGNYGYGTLFEMDLINNVFTKKFDFDDTLKGAHPWGALMQASNGKIYGMTKEGGVYGQGVLFEYNPSTNLFTKKIDFDGTNNGGYPSNYIMQATNGKLYGMTSEGGVNDDGVLFEYNISTSTLTKKIDFDDNSKGRNPVGSLVQALNGKLYGTTTNGGTDDVGVIFEYDPLTNSYNKEFDFNSMKGVNPSGSLILAPNGKLYGMTYYPKGVIYEYDPATNIYNKLMEIYGYINGSNPRGAFFQASNGKLYAMTKNGGIHNKGVLFEYDISNNNYTKKLDFNGINGMHPVGVLIEVCTNIGIGLNAPIKVNSSLNIYPNPNQGQFNLEIESSSNKQQEYQLEIYSATGELVFSKKIELNSFDSKSLNMGVLSKGVYFVYLNNEKYVLDASFIIE